MPTVTLYSNSTKKALTTLARMKLFLDIGSTKKDGRLSLLINQSTDTIEAYTKRRILSQTYTDKEIDGTGKDFLILEQFPVTTLTRLQERDTDEPDVDNFTTVDDKEYFFYEDGRIQKRQGRWSAVPQKFRATYVAGFLIDFTAENTPASHTLPGELEYVCQALVAGVFNTARGMGQASNRIGDSSVTMNRLIHENEDIRRVLDRYVKISV